MQLTAEKFIQKTSCMPQIMVQNPHGYGIAGNNKILKQCHQH